MNIIKNSLQHLSSPAVSCKNRIFTYSNILSHSLQISSHLNSLPRSSNIVFLAPQSYEFIPSQWGIWLAGHVSVPLCPSHPPSEWSYILQDSKTPLVLCHSSYIPLLSPVATSLNIPLVPIPDFSPLPLSQPEVNLSLPPSSPAQMIYTSGTTGKAKGVISSHKAICSQVNSLTEAWEWTSSDHILQILPLHHVHGNINVVTCALNSGARITFHEKFESKSAWDEIINNDLTLFMGVPTIYLKLIQEFNKREKEWQQAAKKNCKKLRLMVCGSMALPEVTLAEWKEISGHVLLERYGMTECGMILSNPLNGIRKPGFVGRPLPGVKVRVVESELRVKSDGMFSEYFGKEKATLESFDEDGWFKTGDIVSVDEDGDFKIMGRASVDILKVSGYKLSALEIENDILGHPDVTEVAIVGIDDKMYGQKIGMVFKARRELKGDEIKEWCKDKMAYYKIPKVFKQMDEIPRNQMGKVNKKDLIKYFS